MINLSLLYTFIVNLGNRKTYRETARQHDLLQFSASHVRVSTCVPFIQIYTKESLHSIYPRISPTLTCTHTHTRYALWLPPTHTHTHYGQRRAHTRHALHSLNMEWFWKYYSSQFERTRSRRSILLIENIYLSSLSPPMLTHNVYVYFVCVCVCGCGTIYGKLRVCTTTIEQRYMNEWMSGTLKVRRAPIIVILCLSLRMKTGGELRMSHSALYTNTLHIYRVSSCVRTQPGRVNRFCLCFLTHFHGHFCPSVYLNDICIPCETGIRYQWGEQRWISIETRFSSSIKVYSPIEL